MEAIGRYHRLAHRTLNALGFDVMAINPFQSRHCAKSMNIWCVMGIINYIKETLTIATPPSSLHARKYAVNIPWHQPLWLNC
jgi:hypothetical protein